MIRLPDGYCLTRALSQVKTVMLPRSCQRYRFVPPSLPLTHFLLHEFLHGEERVYMYTAHASLFQEHDTFTVPPVSMTMGHTKHGFPSVHELDQKSITRSETLGEPASQDKTTRRTTKKSKSLFSQQFESHSAEYFGIEMQAPQINFPMQRDRVEPIRLTGRIVKVPGLSENRQDASSNRGRSDTKDPLPPTSGAEASSSGIEGVAATHGRGGDGDAEVLKKHFASAASQTWERYSNVRSESLVSLSLLGSLLMDKTLIISLPRYLASPLRFFSCSQHTKSAWEAPPPDVIAAL